MGLAASQARLISLQSRMTDLEYEGQQINQQRQMIANKMTEVYNTSMDLEVPTTPSKIDYRKDSYTRTLNGYDYKFVFKDDTQWHASVKYTKYEVELGNEQQSQTIKNVETIAEKDEKCPVVPSCKVGQYRCENGGCAYNKDKCVVDNEYKCQEGEQKCPDGLCHKNCEEVAYQGCLVGEFLCSNGMCVKSEVFCAGYSMCEDPSVPYRCINGECKSDISLCPEVLSHGMKMFQDLKFSIWNHIMKV